MGCLSTKFARSAPRQQTHLSTDSIVNTLSEMPLYHWMSIRTNDFPALFKILHTPEAVYYTVAAANTAFITSTWFEHFYAFVTKNKIQFESTEHLPITDMSLATALLTKKYDAPITSDTPYRMINIIIYGVPELNQSPHGYKVDKIPTNNHRAYIFHMINTCEQYQTMFIYMFFANVMETACVFEEMLKYTANYGECANNITRLMSNMRHMRMHKMHDSDANAEMRRAILVYYTSYVKYLTNAESSDGASISDESSSNNDDFDAEHIDR